MKKLEALLAAETESGREKHHTFGHTYSWTADQKQLIEKASKDLGPRKAAKIARSAVIKALMKALAESKTNEITEDFDGSDHATARRTDSKGTLTPGSGSR